MTLLPPPPTPTRTAALAAAVLAGAPLDRAAARELAAVTGEARYDLFHHAHQIRLRFVGPAVSYCSIVAGKAGACTEDCAYCSQSRRHHTHVQPGRLTVEQIAAVRDAAIAQGASHFGVVNSGRGPTASELDWLRPFFTQTAAQGRIAPCATLGELTDDQARDLRAIGVARINHNLETSRRNFPNIITTHSYDDRVRTIALAKRHGFQVCAGGIFGMGETWDDRIDMALELRALGVDTVPMNFLNAIAGTMVHGKFTPLPPLECLHIIALYRFLLPDKELKIAAGRDTILRDLHSWVFYAGGNSFFLGNYLTTTGRSPEADHQMLRDLEVPVIGQHEAVPPVQGPADEPAHTVSLPVVG